jgi:hypothetical protein
MRRDRDDMPERDPQTAPSREWLLHLGGADKLLEYGRLLEPCQLPDGRKGRSIRAGAAPTAPTQTAVTEVPPSAPAPHCVAEVPASFPPAVGLPLWMSDEELLALIRVRLAADPDGPFAEALVVMLQGEVSEHAG